MFSIHTATRYLLYHRWADVRKSFDGLSGIVTNELKMPLQLEAPAKYPAHFARFEYGKLFKSIIFTFQLRNAYLTNLIKCGMNDPGGKFKGYRHYDKRAINMCYANFLSKEIQLIQPSVIFCIGSNVYDDFMVPVRK